jgi:DNA modification methylase
MLKRESPEAYESVKAGCERLVVAKRQFERKNALQRLMEKAQAFHANSTRVSWEIRQGDCVSEMEKLQPGTVRLIFADAPYNIGIDYGDGTAADALSDDAYLAWCREWIAACVRVLTNDGSLWVMINDEYADYYGVILREVGLHRRSWIKWYETFGVNCSNNFNRCSRHIFYCVKDANRFVFNRDAVTRESDRQRKYDDPRADPTGKMWDNVWCIPRLVGTSTERIPGFPTQLPLDLVRPIVLCASDPGDLILDPFTGSGTTGVAAVESHRRFIGFERNPEFVHKARQRISIRA